MLWTRLGTMLDELCAVLQTTGCKVIEISVTVSPADDEETPPGTSRVSEETPWEG